MIGVYILLNHFVTEVSKNAFIKTNNLWLLSKILKVIISILFG